MWSDDFAFLGRLDPWRELSRLQEDVNRLFTGARGSRAFATSYPPLSVWTNDEGAFVRAELSGLSSKDLDLSVLGNTLTLSGQRKSDDVKDVTYHRREREHGNFSRTLELPFRIEAEKVHAEFKNGVLELFLPWAASDKPRRIVRLAVEIWLPFSKAKDPSGILEAAALNCPVHHSLHPSIERPVIFHWQDESP